MNLPTIKKPQKLQGRTPKQREEKLNVKIKKMIAINEMKKNELTYP